MPTDKIKIVVLDGYTLNPGDLNWGELEALGTCEIYERSSPKEVIEVKLLEVPTQFTTKELNKLEKLSTTDSFAKKILKRLVFVSTTIGSTD